MQRVHWLTDIHLDHISQKGKAEFRDYLDALEGSLIISGDIGEGPTVAGYLRIMGDLFRGKIYFVLGNHDYYHDNIESVRHKVRLLYRENPSLCWLTETGPVKIADHMCILGHDGWYDGREGNFRESKVRLTDFKLIGDLRVQSRSELLAKMQEIADSAIEHLRQHLPRVMSQFEQVLYVCHVPPFKEASLYMGEIGDEMHLPFFVNRRLGEEILKVAADFPLCKLTVLCGHTHHSAEVLAAPNVCVRVGRAEYGSFFGESVLTLE